MVEIRIPRHSVSLTVGECQVENLTNLSPTTLETLTNKGFNCIVCGSALGYNHIPALGWATAFNMISHNGWIAFNVQKERWEDKSEASFLSSHPWIAEKDIFKIANTHNYRHRFYMDGRSLDYVAILGTKQGNL